jgi:glycosyltransferase involved in cell wall biosynthesis
MNTISLCMTTNNPNKELLAKALNSAVGFDEIILHINNVPINTDLGIHFGPNIKVIWHPDNLTAAEGFNFCINAATSEWICCFCDDDFFHEQNLAELLTRFRNNNIEADIVQFPCYVGNDDIDWRIWGNRWATNNGMREGNMIPFSSFYKKILWTMVEGYTNLPFNDWVFWLRVLRQGAMVTLHEKPIYYFRQGVEERLSDREYKTQLFEITHKQILDNLNEDKN